MLKKKKIKLLDKFLNKASKDNNYQEAIKSCNDPELVSLLNMSDKINKSAQLTKPAASGNHKEKLLNKLLEAREGNENMSQESKTKAKKPLLGSFFKMPAFKAVPAFIILVLVIFGGYYFYQYLLPTDQTRIPLIKTVQAGEGYVPVSIPIKIDFPYINANLEELKEKTIIEPEIDFELEIDKKENILTIKHEKNLKYDTLYSITISKGLKIDTEKKLNDDFIFSFSTRPKGQERVLSLQDHLYQYYTLNYYEADYEILLDWPVGRYQVDIYNSDLENFLKAVETNVSWDRDANTWNKPSFAQGIKIDSQIIELGAGEENFYSYKPDLAEIGIYYAEVKGLDNNNTDSFFIVLSKNVVKTFRLGEEMVTWVVDQKSSQAVKDAQVKGYGFEEQKLLFEENTDQQGLVKTSIPLTNNQEKIQVITVKNGEDISVLNLGWSFIYGQDWEAGNRIKPIKAYIYTDRPLYKPGDNVQFKAVIWKNDQDTYNIIDQEMTVRVIEDTYGDQQETIFEQKLRTSDFGTLDSSLKINEDLKTGRYKIVIEKEDQKIAESKFNVEYYQKPEFEININPDKEKYIKGEEIKVDIKAEYFFGEPLKNTEAKIKIFNYNTEQFTKEFSLNENGNATITIPTSNFKMPSWHSPSSALSLNIEVEITDNSGKTFSDIKSIDFYSGKHYFEITEPQNIWDLKNNKDYKFVIQTNDTLTKERQADTPINIRIEKSQGNEVILEDNDKITDVLGEYEFNYNFKQYGYYMMIITSQDSFKNYIEQKHYFYIHESNYQNYWQNKEEFADKIIITADKEKYKIGDTAIFSLKLPRPSGDIFWSVNKNIFHQIETENISNQLDQKIEIKIEENHVPGFYLFISLYQDDIYIEQNQFIEVEGKKINLKLTPNSNTYKPGDDIKIKVKTENIDNTPVSAETSLSVIDKAILALKDDQSGDIYNSFYPKVNYNMTDFDSLMLIFFGGAERGGCFTGDTKILTAKNSYQNIENLKIGDQVLTKQDEQSRNLVPAKIVNIYKHKVTDYLIINNKLKVTPVHRIFINGKWEQVSKAQIGDWFIDQNNQKVIIRSIRKINHPTQVYNLEIEKYHTYIAEDIYVHNDKGDAAPRSEFVDTAFWQANILTNNKGEAEVNFTLPDNLTTWVAMSKAVSKNYEAGQTQTEFKTTQDLIISPRMPQFVRIDDEIVLSSAVHNNLGRDADFEISLEVKNAQLINEPKKEIKINNKDIKNTSWRIKVNNSDQIETIFKVKEKNGKASDSVKYQIPVYSNLNLYRQTYSGNQNQNLSFNFQSNLFADQRQAKLIINSSVLSVLPDILRKQTGYPYGCVEQTMSKHLPNMIVYREKDTLGLKLNSDYQNQINQGFDRLANFQLDNGSFGWWQGDQENIPVTGFVFEGLKYAKDAGLLTYRQSLYDKTYNFLKNIQPRLNQDEQIYVNYILSQTDKDLVKQSTAEYAEQLLLDGKEFHALNKGYLALTLHNIGDEVRAKAVLTEIIADLNNNHWQIKNIGYGSFYDSYLATGINLQALIKIDPQNSNISGIVQWLMSNRNSYHGLWGSTRQTSQILFALIDYIKTSEELNPNYNYSINLNGHVLETESVNDSKYKIEYSLPLDKLNEQNNILEFNWSGNGNLYWQLITSEYLPAASLPNRFNEDFFIYREYRDQNGHKKDNFNVGDLVTVNLHIENTSNMNYLIVEDYLPANFSPLNPRLSADKRFQYYSFNEMDIRDQKVAIFRTYLWPGKHNLSYQARVTHAGRLNAPSPFAELMYQPGINANGQAQSIDVQY